MALSCKYCGKETKPSGSSLVAGGTATCTASPSKKHVSIPNGTNCVFCGKEAKPSGNSLVAGGTATCTASPSKKHQLAE